MYKRPEFKAPKNLVEQFDFSLYREKSEPFLFSHAEKMSLNDHFTERLSTEDLFEILLPNPEFQEWIVQEERSANFLYYMLERTGWKTKDARRIINWISSLPNGKTLLTSRFVEEKLWYILNVHETRKYLSRIVSLLLQEGLNPNMVDKEGNSFFMECIDNDLWQVVYSLYYAPGFIVPEGLLDHVLSHLVQ